MPVTHAPTTFAAPSFAARARSSLLLKALSALATTLVVAASGLATGCSGTDDEDTRCRIEDHCLRTGGEAHCEDGYEWDNPRDPDDYTCVLEGFGGDGDDDAAEVDPKAPIILSLSINNRLVHDDDVRIISVVVTDPDGIDDVIGGVLEDAHGTSYGPFIAHEGEGAYGFAVDWEVMNAVALIDAGQGTEGKRTVFVRFFDEDGRSVVDALELRFRCRDEDRVPCGGRCADLSSDAEHCGGCGLDCDGCEDGQCIEYPETECVEVPRADPSSTTSGYVQLDCSEVCGGMGQCSDACANLDHRVAALYPSLESCEAYGSRLWPEQEGCGSTVAYHPSSEDPVFGRCCCG